ncbi:adenylate/guanylate cyclase domain-containing protein [Candidatus Leptofilum sp.]|uniref:adenylate/guanylate cyclase domain-containing protein n=1 Tax=Candidatus Leptofilum sp. TaxID=3241576 RepID=UPI003B5B3A03
MSEQSEQDGRFYYRWEWQLQSTPEAFWPFFADTNRLNRDTGIFPVAELPPQPEDIGTGRRRLRFQLPIPFSWVEEPFEWVAPYRYGVLRHYQNGPLRAMEVLATISPQKSGGSTLVYETWLEPRNIVGRLAAPIALGIIAPRRFGKAVEKYDAIAAIEAPPLLLKRPYRLVPGAEGRMNGMADQLLAQGVEKPLLDLLLREIKEGDDLTLAHLRPYALADQWNVPRRDVLELALMATRAGLLDFQWELLCPLCRGASDRVHNHLSEMRTNVHCPTCNIDFQADNEHAIELTFAPNSSIRPVERTEFCVAGPQQTPHIAVQQLLPPGATRTVQPKLKAGRYRMRTANLPGSRQIVVTEQETAAQTFEIQPGGWPSERVSLQSDANLTLHNQSDAPQLFILEEMAWSDQAITAAEVISLQSFRDLFTQEALEPGQQFSVGSLTVLFTDLRDSTRLYREIGDAPAFGLVRNHFDVLHDAIAEEEGAIVKTIGDAVMAVFRRPISAVRAIVKSQAILANPMNGERPLQIKAAIHAGHSIAVTLNERLDYFGTNINIAARLEKFSQGNDLILSDFVYCDPEVQALIHDANAPMETNSFEAQLKGFDDERFNLWRVVPKHQ